jgi:hypothetical protein
VGVSVGVVSVGVVSAGVVSAGVVSAGVVSVVSVGEWVRHTSKYNRLRQMYLTNFASCIGLCHLTALTNVEPSVWVKICRRRYETQK